MTLVRLAPAVDLAAVEHRWRDLEGRADLSFFQSWTWLGCRARERFDDPWLLEARRDGTTSALALLNRRPRALYLGETGHPAEDAVFTEHNGIVLARDGGADLLTDCLRVAAARRLVLSGTDDAHLAALRALPGLAHVRQTRPAPCVEYGPLGHRAFLDSLSPNTRYQVRRSDRRYETRGPLRVERAASVAEAHAHLDALAALHQRYWTARGRPGAFADPAFGRFHRGLIERGLPRGEVDLLRIAAGESVIGYLYNFVHRGHVLAYQSGFDYAGASDPHAKPGLTCHRLAIDFYRARGMRRYDFLAGEDRYKRSFGNGEIAMHWVEFLPRFSLPWLGARARLFARRLAPSGSRGSGGGSRALPHGAGTLQGHDVAAQEVAAQARLGRRHVADEHGALRLRVDEAVMADGD